MILSGSALNTGCTSEQHHSTFQQTLQVWSFMDFRQRTGLAIGVESGPYKCDHLATTRITHAFPLRRNRHQNGRCLEPTNGTKRLRHFIPLLLNVAFCSRSAPLSERRKVPTLSKKVIPGNSQSQQENVKSEQHGSRTQVRQGSHCMRHALRSCVIQDASRVASHWMRHTLLPLVMLPPVTRCVSAHVINTQRRHSYPWTPAMTHRTTHPV